MEDQVVASRVSLNPARYHRMVEVGRSPGHGGCPEPHPDSFWISPRMETAQPPWPTWASTPSPSQQVGSVVLNLWLRVVLCGSC